MTHTFAITIDLRFLFFQKSQTPYGVFPPVSFSATVPPESSSSDRRTISAPYFRFPRRSTARRTGKASAAVTTPTRDRAIPAAICPPFQRQRHASAENKNAHDTQNRRRPRRGTAHLFIERPQLVQTRLFLFGTIGAANAVYLPTFLFRRRGIGVSEFILRHFLSPFLLSLLLSLLLSDFAVVSPLPAPFLRVFSFRTPNGRS